MIQTFDKSLTPALAKAELLGLVQVIDEWAKRSPKITLSAVTDKDKLVGLKLET